MHDGTRVSRPQRVCVSDSHMSGIPSTKHLLINMSALGSWWRIFSCVQISVSPASSSGTTSPPVCSRDSRPSRHYEATALHAETPF